MYANTENPPSLDSSERTYEIDTEHHSRLATQITQILHLIRQARDRMAKCYDDYDHYVMHRQPYDSRESLHAKVKKWIYISTRLERYYFRKVCELNSLAYKGVMHLRKE